jgi:hypothetical protein
LPAEFAAAIGHRLFGTGFALLGASGHGPWYAIMPVVLDPAVTTHQVRVHASALQPGSRVRRLVFWRYFLL